MDENRRLHPWELALLVSVCLTLLIGTWAGARQEMLADRLVRLHVIANSDSETDQAEKLRVRDAVLAYLAPKLERAGSFCASEMLPARRSCCIGSGRTSCARRRRRPTAP